MAEGQRAAGIVDTNPNSFLALPSALQPRPANAPTSPVSAQMLQPSFTGKYLQR